MLLIQISRTRFLYGSLNRRDLNLHSKYAQYLSADIAATYCERPETSGLFKIQSCGILRFV